MATSTNSFGGIEAKIDEILSLLTTGTVWTRTVVTIPALSTVTVDTNLLSSFSRIDHIMSFKKLSDGTTKSLSVAIQNNDGNISETIATRLGGNINLSISVSENSVDEMLDVTNNEASALTLTLLKAKS